MLRNFGHNGPEINEKKKNFWTVVPIFEHKQRCFVEFCKIIPVFAQEKKSFN